MLIHFVVHGFNEGRIASADFDVEFYRANYDDLINEFGNRWKSYFIHFIIFGKRKEDNVKENY